MSAQLPGSHDAATGQDTLANWLALIALLALGIVWPPANSASADPGATGRVAIHTHAALTQQASALLSRSRCEGGAPARTR